MSRFILSKNKVLEQYNILKELCDEVAYSLKTNNDVGKVLEENTDCSFAVHSIEGLILIRDKRRAWFFGQGWDFRELEFLFNNGLRKFVIDNENDLKIFLKFI
jgi:ornithine decarboxylase